MWSQKLKHWLYDKLKQQCNMVTRHWNLNNSIRNWNRTIQYEYEELKHSFNEKLKHVSIAMRENEITKKKLAT